MLSRYLAGALLWVPLVALAHHSFAMFDMSKDTALQGTVVQFQWQSPHSWLDIMVTEHGGATHRWGLEMGAPNALYRRGWRQASLKHGDKVTAVMHPLRDGRRGGSLVSVTLPDGTQLFGSGGSAAPAAPPGGRP